MKILLLGLGRANIYVARYLLEKGHDIYLFEENMRGLNDEARKLLREGNIKEYRDIEYDLAICSPGFPESKPIIEHIRKSGTELIDETEFTFSNIHDPQVVAVTGTNGKSTTAALISSILENAGIRNFLGGNIAPGQPFSSVLFQKPYTYYILEMSSFQLSRIKKFHPRIAVLTNISPDHLNWHQNLNQYISAKKRIFTNQTVEDYAVINFEDENVRSAVKDVEARIIYFGQKCKEGAWLNGRLHFQNDEIISRDEIPLPGYHNQLNALAAIAVAKILQISNQCIRGGIRNFKSLPHRLEDIGIIDGIRYVNNSMSTNEASAIASFKALPGNKIVIVGGREKGDRCENYLRLLIGEAKAIVILGENAKRIAMFLEENKYNNYVVVQDMNEAIVEAKKFANAGDTIMLNPGFASFGNFRDFQERGDAFKHGVLKY
ncbi:MAG: UDP-N-acetylmuramoyl-L-alanine--D-glutamate ligase [candidate division WOR-3 bacterium]